ncbi:hypothetical protein EDC04DRAFT_2605750 [Pisolithus marmoratus]|nr:hypothetical protein EDC04DRAFT_2605750 [Pisolithus marmoratus]
MSTYAFHLTPRMINKEAFHLLSQYATWAISLEHAMDEIQYVLGSNFDKDKWMDVMQCILKNPLCFADMEKVFMERLAEKESSNVTSLAHLLDKPTQQWKDHESEVGTSGKRVEVATEGDNREGMPSTSELQPPSSLVKEAMWAHGISFVTPTDLAPWNSKCQKTGISQFLNLAAEEDDSEDNYADEDINETQGSAGHPTDAGPTRKSSFSHTIDGLMAQYTQSLIPFLNTASAQSFMYEYMESNGINIKPGEKSLFSSELVIAMGLTLVPILSSTGVDIGFTCGGHDFIHGLLLQSGELSGSQGRLIDIEWHKQTASLFLPTDERSEGDVNATGNTIHCTIHELHRVFNTRQVVRIILKVSDLLLEAHMPDHVCSLATGHADTHICLPEPADAVLPSDTVNVSQGAYKGTEAPIKWMSVNGTQAWIYMKETKYSSMQTGIHSTQGKDPNQQEKGFDICVGDNVEVARGKWFWSRGTVQMVHFNNAYLDFVCDTYGQKISIPITFFCKVAEHSGPQLSQWISWDVWVICGEKKGYQGTLRTLGRDISCVAEGNYVKGPWDLVGVS